MEMSNVNMSVNITSEKLLNKIGVLYQCPVISQIYI